MKRIFFFATESDIAAVLTRLEANAPLRFVPTGTTSSPSRPTYLESSQIPNLGIASHETGSMSQGYLISLKGTQDNSEVSITKKGEKRWDLFLGANEDAVSMVHGGLWKTGTLLPGDVVTVHNTAASQQLMKWFLNALKAEGFEKVDMYWVGKVAMAMLKSGRRLSTTAEQSPPDFDLKAPV
jgi:hypothetical protein